MVVHERVKLKGEQNYEEKCLVGLKNKKKFNNCHFSERIFFNMKDSHATDVYLVSKLNI